MRIQPKPPPGNVRRVASFGGNSISIFINKRGELIQTESFNERRLTREWEQNPKIYNYRSQPETFYYTDSRGVERSYTPDFKVWWVDGTIEIYEITIRYRKENMESLRERERAARKICKARDWRYICITEDGLPSLTKDCNLQALEPYRSTDFANENVKNAVLDELEKGGRRNLCELIEAVCVLLELPYQIVFSAIFHMMWQGTIITDFERLILDEALPAEDVYIWLE
jgi:hypothetical protein